MARYVINGGKRLTGSISISGSKNAALGIIAAAMTVDGKSTIENLPRVRDIELLVEICCSIGAKMEWKSHDTLLCDPTTINTQDVLDPKVSLIRGSSYFLGALLGKYHAVKLLVPGGDDFGGRPIDLHLKGFAAMGATVTYETHNGQPVQALRADGALIGDAIFLDNKSVGATINLMIAATHGKGTTIIDNAAREPHIVDVANFLNVMGAEIRGAGTESIRIVGKSFLPGGKIHTVIPDQIEAGTYMMMAPLTGGDITVKDVVAVHMESLTLKLREMGTEVTIDCDRIRVRQPENTPLRPTSFATRPYPGYPTDLQPQSLVLLCNAQGSGRVAENVFKNRFQYIEQLRLMQAPVEIFGNVATVMPTGQNLVGTEVQALDIRGGVAMVMAGLIADGQTIVNDINEIERGYEAFIEKMQSIGADITRQES